MKNFWQSMTSRVFLILLIGIVITGALAMTLAAYDRARILGQLRDLHTVDRVAQFILSLETMPIEMRPSFYDVAAVIGTQASRASAEDASLPASSSLVNQLNNQLPGDYDVRSAEAHTEDCALARSRARRGLEGRGPCEAMLVSLPDGDHLRISVLPPRTPSIVPRFDSYGPIILFLISISVLAMWVARMTMAPLKRLAQAATELGQDIDREPIPISGTSEIRQASAAFNAMQARIRQHIRQRTHILAAITHDLQTPLTRLRLRLEKVEDTELREKLINDLSATQKLVKEGLDLARSIDSVEPLRALDVDSLVDSVCNDAADTGQDVQVEQHCKAAVMARPATLQRCLENLISNAVKYGNQARVYCSAQNGRVKIVVKDAGPGIPHDEIDNVFEPFYRLETSRSRDTGGTGIGLTIARNIAEQHGGTLTLRNGAQGGLEAELDLPAKA